MSKTIWDVVDDVFIKHGIAGLMLLIVCGMYWHSQTNQQKNHDKIVEKLTVVERKVDVIQYQVNDMERDVDKLMAYDEKLKLEFPLAWKEVEYEFKNL